MFANSLGDRVSIPGRLIPETQKMILDAALLNTQHNKVWIKGKVDSHGNGVAPSPTTRDSSFCKRSLRASLDEGHQFYYCFSTSMALALNNPRMLICHQKNQSNYFCFFNFLCSFLFFFFFFLTIQYISFFLCVFGVSPNDITRPEKKNQKKTSW